MRLHCLLKLILFTPAIPQHEGHPCHLMLPPAAPFHLTARHCVAHTSHFPCPTKFSDHFPDYNGRHAFTHSMVGTMQAFTLGPLEGTRDELRRRRWDQLREHMSDSWLVRGTTKNIKHISRPLDVCRMLQAGKGCPVRGRRESRGGGALTLMLLRGCRLASLRAAASMEDAAPSSSVSAITVGSSGSAQSLPARVFPALVTFVPTQSLN